jgi:hypothetical protein
MRLVEVYPLNGFSTPMPPPSDMVAWLHSLTKQGASIQDEKTATVGGITAHVMTMSSDQALDGMIGCPFASAEQHEQCIGLGPDVIEPMAVLNVKGQPLLIWTRTDGGNPDTAFLSNLEPMLSTVEFH